jgi:hypothetical protein
LRHRDLRRWGRLERAEPAFGPTCDESCLGRALDEYRGFAKQASYFTTARDTPGSGDAAFVRQEAGDFFAPVERRIADVVSLYRTLVRHP